AAPAINVAGGTGTHAGDIGETGGPCAIAKNGAGTLVLSGASTYSGGTTINAGTLQVGSNGALGTGNLTLGDNTLQAGVAGLSLSNQIIAAGDGTIDTQAFDLTWSGVIGTGTIDKIGSGALILDNVGMNDGTITVSAGKVAGVAAGVLGQATNYSVATGA